MCAKNNPLQLVPTFPWLQSDAVSLAGDIYVQGCFTVLFSLLTTAVSADFQSDGKVMWLGTYCLLDELKMFWIRISVDLPFLSTNIWNNFTCITMDLLGMHKSTPCLTCEP